ncbi:ClbS/DfsB family four-helix bundle protein [uncultured Helicobacter sp.]
MLEKSHIECMELIETLPQKELFVKKQYKWCAFVDNLNSAFTT